MNLYRNIFEPQSEYIIKSFILSKEPFISLNNFAKSIGATQSGVSRTFASLEGHGFIYRQKDKKSLIPIIISGRGLLESWLAFYKQKYIGGHKDFLTYKDPAPLKEEICFEYMKQDIFPFIADNENFALSGQTALHLLGLKISNCDNFVIHVKNQASLAGLLEIIQYAPATKNDKGVLIVKNNSHLISTQKISNILAADSISLYLDTVFAPARGEEQREFLLEQIFQRIFQEKGWRL